MLNKKQTQSNKQQSHMLNKYNSISGNIRFTKNNIHQKQKQRTCKKKGNKMLLSKVNIKYYDNI